MKKFISVIILLCFFVTSGTGNYYVYAQAISLPTPGTMVNLSPDFEPVLIKGLKVHPENPFLFDFIIDTGSAPSLVKEGDRGSLKQEVNKLIKYFLASLTIPEKDLWVNLSPYEKDRMIAPNLGQTEMGRDMLAQDYILKQLTASLIYPEKHLGKTFWDEVYAKAQEQYGTTQIPVNTFNKVWIVADKADVFERGNAAYVVGAHLKVMLEEDYLALEKNQAPTRGHVPREAGYVSPSTQGNKQPTNAIASQIIRHIILPQIEKEVNEGQNFAPLRQMFYAMILASWYKTALKDALLTQIYGNQSKVKVGINQPNPKTNEEIFNRYLKAYKKGVFNYIKEDIDQTSKQPLPRKYFSGGAAIWQRMPGPHVTHDFSPAMLASSGRILVAQVTASPDFYAALKSNSAMIADEHKVEGGVLYTVGKGKDLRLVLDREGTTLAKVLSRRKVVVDTLVNWRRRTKGESFNRTLSIYEDDPDKIERINMDWNSLFKEGKITSLGKHESVMGVKKHISFSQFLEGIKKRPESLFEYIQLVGSLTSNQGSGIPLYKALIFFTVKMLGVDPDAAMKTKEKEFDDDVLYMDGDRLALDSDLTSLTDAWKGKTGVDSVIQRLSSWGNSPHPASNKEFKRILARYEKLSIKQIQGMWNKLLKYGKHDSLPAGQTAALIEPDTPFSQFLLNIRYPSYLSGYMDRIDGVIKKPLLRQNCRALLLITIVKFLKFKLPDTARPSQGPDAKSAEKAASETFPVKKFLSIEDMVQIMQDSGKIYFIPTKKEAYGPELNKYAERGPIKGNINIFLSNPYDVYSFSRDNFLKFYAKFYGSNRVVIAQMVNRISLPRTMEDPFYYRAPYIDYKDIKFLLENVMGKEDSSKVKSKRLLRMLDLMRSIKEVSLPYTEDSLARDVSLVNYETVKSLKSGGDFIRIKLKSPHRVITLRIDNFLGFFVAVMDKNPVLAEKIYQTLDRKVPRDAAMMAVSKKNQNDLISAIAGAMDTDQEFLKRAAPITLKWLHSKELYRIKNAQYIRRIDIEDELRPIIPTWRNIYIFSKARWVKSDEALRYIKSAKGLHRLIYRDNSVNYILYDPAIVTRGNRDSATRGGIDFTRSHMQMNLRKEGAGVQMKFDPAMVERIKREGFEGLDFQIQSIVPVTDLIRFLFERQGR